MSSVDEQVALFSDLTGCPPDQAQFFLQSAGGNLELAVNEFFLSQEEGAPMDEGSDGEDEGEDGYDDEDAEMDMPPLIPVSPSAPGAPPPSKRPKVEMRQVRAHDTPSRAARCHPMAAWLYFAGAKPPRRVGGAADAAAAGLRPRRQAQRRGRDKHVESASWARLSSPPCLLRQARWLWGALRTLKKLRPCRSEPNETPRHETPAAGSDAVRRTSCTEMSRSACTRGLTTLTAGCLTCCPASSDCLPPRRVAGAAVRWVGGVTEEWPGLRSPLERRHP